MLYLRIIIISLIFTINALSLQEGDPAPSWAIPSVYDGHLVHSQDFTNHIVVLNFFDISCPGSLAEIPPLVALHNQYTNLNLIVIGIAIFNDPASVEAIVNDYSVPYPVCVVSSQNPVGAEIVRDYNVLAYPYTFIIDHSNIVRKAFYGLASKSSISYLTNPLIGKAPRLLIHSSPTNVLISWPTLATNSHLESTRIGTTTNWNIVSGYPTNIVFDSFTNSFYQISIPLTNTFIENKQFRLR